MTENPNEELQFTQEEFDKAQKILFSSLLPLKLKQYPAKMKKKIIVLTTIAESFEYGREYTEQEVNGILSPIWEDYATIRRALIDFRFLARSAGGKAYWRLTPAQKT